MKMILLRLFLISILSIFIQSACAAGRGGDRHAHKAVSKLQYIKSIGDASAFLKRFGYMIENPLRPSAETTAAIKAYQKMMGLRTTGRLDHATMGAMNSPRCGNPDYGKMTTTGLSIKLRDKRYALHGSKWKKSLLTYKISRYPNPRRTRLSNSAVRAYIAASFALWAAQTPLRFRFRISGKVDLEVMFAAGRHGDGYPFDGAGKTLAHAFYPKYGGDIHFDDAEKWIASGRATGSFSLKFVATHEIGHALGLKHSSVKSAIMYPSYHYMAVVRLHSDDVKGIRKIYPSRGCRWVSVRQRYKTSCGWWWRKRTCYKYRNVMKRVCS